MNLNDDPLLLRTVLIFYASRYMSFMGARIQFLLCMVTFVCLGPAESPGQAAHDLDTSTHASGEHKSSDAIKVGVVGLVHTHVHWILGRAKNDDIEIVGIVEPNRDLATRYSKQHGFSMDLVFDSIEQMVEAKQPDAVTAFNTIYDHLSVVEFCAPRGIHVMVEKPLAVSLDHARQMHELASKHNIHLLTNYETSWYPTTHESFRIVDTGQLAEIRKINFYTGHPGPIEIGCNPEFVEWLVDPKKNGGGALMDFGCYGANLATFFLQGKHPTSIACVTSQNKPKIYTDVEDDATIILNYPKTQVLIQASWNWSHNRKEMELFGKGGYIKCLNGTEMSVMLNEKEGPKPVILESSNQPIDPFGLLQKVVRKHLVLKEFDVSSIENNLMVMRILEAAKIAAKEKRTVDWSEVSE